MTTTTLRLTDPQTKVDLVTTDLNSLGIGARTPGTTVDHTIAGSGLLGGATLGGLPYGHFELSVTFATAPTAGLSVNVYWLASLDGGTTFPDGSATVAPQTSQILCTFEVRNISTVQVLGARDIPIPSGVGKLVVENATDQDFAASGNVLSVALFSEQGS